MVAWNLDETLSPAYVALTDVFICDSVLGTGAVVTDLDACKVLCNAKKAWTMSSDLPSTASKTAGVDYCYGVNWATDTTTCSMYIAVSNIVATTGTASNRCYTRTKSTVATALVNALPLSVTAGTTHAAMVAGIAVWATAN